MLFISCQMQKKNHRNACQLEWALTSCNICAFLQHIICIKQTSLDFEVDSFFKHGRWARINYRDHEGHTPLHSSQFQSCVMRNVSHIHAKICSLYKDGNEAMIIGPHTLDCSFHCAETSASG